jgi:transposase-like protein
VKALLAGDEEFLRALMRTALQEVLEAEMTEALGSKTSAHRKGTTSLFQTAASGSRRRRQRHAFFCDPVADPVRCDRPSQR